MAPPSTPSTTTPTSVPGGPDLSQLTQRPGPRRPSSGPMFLPADPTQSPTVTAASLPGASPQEASPSAAGAPSDEMPEQSGAPRTSSKASSGRTTTKAILRKTARALVEVIGGYANDYLARDAAAREVEMYVADEEDQEAIGDPVAEIAYRHGRMGEFASPDVADAIDMMVGLTIYAVKLLAKRKRAKAIRNAHQDGTATLAAAAPGTGDQQ